MRGRGKKEVGGVEPQTALTEAIIEKAMYIYVITTILIKYINCL